MADARLCAGEAGRHVAPGLLSLGFTQRANVTGSFSISQLALKFNFHN
jgi:hypothetical protein